MSESAYAEVKREVEQAGYFTSWEPIRRTGDRLVLASQQHLRGLTGNSFWIATRTGTWYLGTWGGHIYRIPDAGRVPGLCIGWLGSTHTTQWDIDAARKVEFGLVELDEEETDRVFGGD